MNSLAMTPRLRKLALTAHISFSVGWLGACSGFLALSIAGVTSQHAEVVRGAYLSMDLIGKFLIVPMSFAALATGLVMALGTPWGLLRRYWVVVKFLLTILSITILLLHQFTAVAAAAKRVSGTAVEMLPKGELNSLGFVLMRASGLGTLVLLAVTTLSVFKPWGLTRYGLRIQEERRKAQPPRSPQTLRVAPMVSPENEKTGDSPGLGFKIAFAIVGVIMAVIIALHLTGHGFGMHGH